MSDYIPKVGEDFEYSVFGKIWEWQSCIAVTKSLVIGENINGEETPFRINSNKFRPIMSARDRAIDEMASIAHAYLTDDGRFASLYDAGYRMVRPLSLAEYLNLDYKKLIELGHIVIG